MRYEVDSAVVENARTQTPAEQRAWIEREVRNFRSVSEGVTWRMVENFREDLEDQLSRLIGVLPPTEHIIPYETMPVQMPVSRRRRQRKDAN